MPITSLNTGRSRCQPMPAPGIYSVISACSNASGGRRKNAAARSRSGSRKSGISDAGRTRFEAKIVMPAKRDGTAIAEIAVKLEGPEVERAKRLDELGFVLR